MISSSNSKPEPSVVVVDETTTAPKVVPAVVIQEAEPTLSFRAVEEDTTACARTGSTVGKTFSYIGYVLFFVILVNCEFALVHEDMQNWTNTFVFYIVFFYYLTELLINLLVRFFLSGKLMRL